MESSAQANVSPVGVGSDCQASSPANTSAYREANISASIDASITDWTSAGDGQMSLRYTGAPDGSVPSGSVVRSTSIRPAIA